VIFRNNSVIGYGLDGHALLRMGFGFPQEDAVTEKIPALGLQVLAGKASHDFRDIAGHAIGDQGLVNGYGKDHNVPGRDVGRTAFPDVEPGVSHGIGERIGYIPRNLHAAPGQKRQNKSRA